MTSRSLEIPNVSGKTVDNIVLHDDPLSGRELTIRFTDGTELSVMVSCKQIAQVRHFDVSRDQTLFENEHSFPGGKPMLGPAQLGGKLVKLKLLKAA